MGCTARARQRQQQQLTSPFMFWLPLQSVVEIDSRIYCQCWIPNPFRQLSGRTNKADGFVVVVDDCFFIFN